MSIEMTVGLPAYRVNGIAWLPMEGLCRQHRPPCPWELLIFEESHAGACGEDFFLAYADRLKKAGCVNIRYITADEWVPLPMKWRAMGQAMAEGSKTFLLQAGDDYIFIF